MNAPTMLRVARDEWPAVVWYCADVGATGCVRGWLCDSDPEERWWGAACQPGSVSVGVHAWQVAGGWNASIVWHTNERRYWRPRGTHPTLRAALRNLRANLAWDLAGAIQAATLMPESADWSAVERLAAVARRWA